jgi:transcriptional regulator with GAF, ATPase, and Fis domain
VARDRSPAHGVLLDGPGNLRELGEVVRRFVIVDDSHRNHEAFQARFAI